VISGRPHIMGGPRGGGVIGARSSRFKGMVAAQRDKTRATREVGLECLDVLHSAKGGCVDLRLSVGMQGAQTIDTWAAKQFGRTSVCGGGEEEGSRCSVQQEPRSVGRWLWRAVCLQGAPGRLGWGLRGTGDSGDERYVVSCPQSARGGIWGSLLGQHCVKGA
jgi:hypothetical protein